MKNIASFILSFALLSIMFSCEEKKETTANTIADESIAEPVSNTLPGESLEELGEPTLSKGSEKFEGEFISNELNTVRLIVRKHPTDGGLLAKNIYIRDKTPGMVACWYNKNQDQVSNRFAKKQMEFTTMKLNETGEILTEITTNLDTNESDTTYYTRSR